MGYFQLFKKVLFVSVIVFLYSCSEDRDAGEDQSLGRKKIAVTEEGFHDWDSFMLRNTYVRCDVVPDLGGKIMGFDLHGFQILWHDSAREGEVDTDQGYGFGANFFNPGGAKVWPAPQGWGGEGEWPGPPDNVLDSSIYECTFEGSTITVISPEDNGNGRTGLQFKNTYSLSGPNSILNLNLSMTNVVNRNVKWGLWHLATVPVDRDFTVYVPVNKGNWHVIFGDKDNPQWLGVENGLFRARYDKRVGKVGMKVREGWVAWHDEEKNIVFAMMYPVEKGAEYPDGGSNFEIWTSGAGTINVNEQDFTYEYTPETAMMELEVMGHLTSLAPGRSTSMDVKWGVCRCSGVKKVLPDGVVAEELVNKEGVITGKFGVFHGGTLQTMYLDKNGKKLSLKNLMDVSPLTEVVINLSSKHIITMRAQTIRFQVLSLDKKHTSVLGEVNLH